MEGGGVAEEVEGVPVPPPLKYDLMPVCSWVRKGGLGDLCGQRLGSYIEKYLIELFLIDWKNSIFFQ